MSITNPRAAHRVTRVRTADSALRAQAPDPILIAWIDRCRELAESHLDGIEDPARELADLAAGNRQLMEHARHMIKDALDHEPKNATLQQMYWFWRRAFEKGSWEWEESPIDHNPLLS